MGGPKRLRVVCLSQARCYAPQETAMSEDERQELVGTVAEAHAGLRELAFKLRRELTPKAPALKAAIRAEGGSAKLW